MSPEVGINEDLQVITYIYIGVISHNPLIRSPLIPSTSGTRDIQAVEICPKFWGKRHVFMQNRMQLRRLAPAPAQLSSLSLSWLSIHRRRKKKTGHGWQYIPDAPKVWNIYLHENHKFSPFWGTIHVYTNIPVFMGHMVDLIPKNPQDFLRGKWRFRIPIKGYNLFLMAEKKRLTGVEKTLRI